jgi:hypothetical protein
MTCVCNWNDPLCRDGRRRCQWWPDCPCSCGCEELCDGCVACDPLYENDTDGEDEEEAR